VTSADRGHDKAGPFLFPRELAQLAACAAVPLWRRRLYVFSVYTGLRAGETRALEWGDVHEAEGFILVHRAIDSITGEPKRTKTGRARRIPIEVELVPLLEAMREESGGNGDPVFPRVPHKSECPWMLRLDLKQAAVTRGELHEDTKTQRKLSFHDLRHTYGT
jgi:integrase